MADTTGVEWADATFNGWWGCAEVSPGCAHCYARTWATWTRGKDLWPPKGQPAADHAFSFSSEANWRKPLKWAGTLPEQLGRRPRIFTASMSDVFEDHPALVEPRERLLQLIVDTPELDWLLLTKRPEVMRDRYFAGGWTLTPNLWLGTSIENARFTWRADVLRDIPAAVRFISAEPLLGSLFPESFECPRCEGQRYDVGSCSLCANRGRLDDRGGRERMPLDLSGIDWVIAGGESGPKARPSHADWFREIRDAVVMARQEARIGDELVYRSDPAFFFKQWGEWAPPDPTTGTRPGDLCWCLELGEKCFVEDDYVCVANESSGSWLRKVGKKRAGRELDGREWSEFPASVAAVPA